MSVNTNKWPSTDNFGSYLNYIYPDTSILNEQVLITEKIDGSNLSRIYDYENSVFTGFASRNQILNVEVFNGASLEPLKKYDESILKLIQEIKNGRDFSNVGKIIVVGEYFGKEWFVFGLLMVNQNGVKEHRYLDMELYELFTKCGFKLPKLFFTGILRNGLTQVKQEMNDQMEGVVITNFSFERQFNYKFKVGLFDERPSEKAKILDGKDFSNEDLASVKIVEEMYFSSKKQEKKQKKNVTCYDLVISSEISKRDIDPVALYQDKKQVGILKNSIVDAIIESDLSNLDSKEKENLGKQVSQKLGKIIGNYIRSLQI
jgi:hypothetical protein